jgi:hypothetical protein
MNNLIQISEYIRNNIFISDHLFCIPLEIKQNIRNIPIFRKTIKKSKRFITSFIEILQYQQISFQNIKFSMDIDFENEFYFYIFRRGIDETLNNK